MTALRPADLVLRGGAVHTVDPARPRAQAVAVRGGRIVAVGTDADVGEHMGPRTRVVELRGRTLLPGFQDAHVHAVTAGLDRLRCDLRGADDADAYLARIVEYAAAQPERPWIVGGGWAMGAFPGGTPDRGLLDAVVPDRPVCLDNRDGHGVWVNSRALELAGIDRHTPDPVDGRIERDADGQPQGTLHEGATALIERHIPQPTAEERGELPARVVVARRWQRDAGLEQLDAFAARRDRSRIGRLRADRLKILLDGVLENFTGAMLEPYLDANGSPTTNPGLLFLEPVLLREVVRRADGLGFHVHVHAIGDRAVREALDAFEAASASNPARDRRHTIAHIQVIHPADLARFAALGVVANGQPYWAVSERQMDVLTITFLGPERTGWQYPFGTLLHVGARLAFGSDWAVSTPNPLEEIEVAVPRLSPDHPSPTPFLPHERITLEA